MSRVAGAVCDPVFVAYLDALRRRQRAPSTLVCNTQALRKLEQWLSRRGIPAAELRPLDCELYFEERLADYAVSTLHHDLSVVRAAYRYSVRHDLLERDPTHDVKLPRLPDIEPATYSNNELRAILAAVRDPREERAFYLFAFAGLRECEAAGLRWNDVDLPHQQLKLNGKGGKFRLVPLHPALSLLLADHQPRCHPDHHHIIPANNGGRLSSRTWNTLLRTLVDRAEVATRAPAHTFRKTVATVMHEQGVATAVIDKILGWAPRTVRDRHYLSIASQSMRDAILTLYHDDPIVPNQLAIPHTAQRDQQPEAPAWLAREHTQLEQLEHQIAADATAASLDLTPATRG